MSKPVNEIKTTIKIQQVERYLQGEISMTAAAKELGVYRSSFRRWIDLYETSGPDSLRPQLQNKEYPKRLKLNAVMDYLTGNTSLSEICKKYQIRSKSQLHQWIKLYNAHKRLKSTGGRYMGKARTTDLDERLKIVVECLANDRDYSEAALKYEVSYHQVRDWVKKYEEMGISGLEDRRGKRRGTLPSRTAQEELQDRIAKLERENRALQMENDLLKKIREIERGED